VLLYGAANALGQALDVVKRGHTGRVGGISELPSRPRLAEAWPSDAPSTEDLRRKTHRRKGDKDRTREAGAFLGLGWKREAACKSEAKKSRGKWWIFTWYLPGRQRSSLVYLDTTAVPGYILWVMDRLHQGSRHCL
jgi:hypothetical protein